MGRRLGGAYQPISLVKLEGGGQGESDYLQLKVWRSGRKCGRAPRLTRYDDARHRCLNPVVRTEVGEIFWL